MSDLKSRIREIPDFPKPGILFKDITTLLLDPKAFAIATREMTEASRAMRPDAIGCIESRGFLFAAPVARDLGVALIPIRKPGKLPAPTYRETYALEYGSDSLEIHQDAVSPAMRVLVLDDLLATGGTAAAAGRLVERSRGVVAGYGFLVELAGLAGRRALGAAPVFSLVTYDGA